MKKILMITLVLAVAGLAEAAIQPLDGDNVVGFSVLSANLGDNQIITVPYVACLGNDGDVVLADLVSTNGLVGATGVGNAGSADQLIVMVDDGGLKYNYYWLENNVGWTGVETSVIMPDGSSESRTPPAASTFSVARGLGFWLKRVASSTGDVYVKGEVSDSNPSTSIVNGLNLVGYGSAGSMTLNSVEWTGADGGNGLTTTSDRIIVVGDDGSLSYYYYFTNPGAGWESFPAGSNWVNSDYSLANVTIPAGQGFWYDRKGATSFDFEPDGSN